ncbi:MAG: DUF349 domain-containing protein [Alistipes sp.]|uniref:DUF349 domain-containing protein n=1 Tax=Alistipes sp. TaxID=1872444 RepID=UPI0025C419ED|nr:DUF349 domain-containing protein [Alistipes sp.]MCD8274137.1 DUF349 domain-containing protein [Alistipes sp.]
MATENPILPAPEEQVSKAAEDVQNVTSEVTPEVPESEMAATAEPETPAAAQAAPEAPAAEVSVTGTSVAEAAAETAAEAPVAEVPAAAETLAADEVVAEAPVGEVVVGTPVAEVSAGEVPAEVSAAEGPAAEVPAEAAPAAEESGRAKRARIKPAAEQVVTETEEEAASDVQVDFTDEEAALAAQDAGLELDGETAEEAEAEQMAENVHDAENKFAGRGKEELVALFTRMLEEQPVQSIRRDVEALKIAFYRIRRAEVEAARRKFIEEGGAEEDFAPAVDGVEVQLKELFKEYRRRRDEFIANLEAEKEKNLQIKLGIIEELKELVNSDETLNHTFTKFRELQQRWKETGIVPLQNVKDLWETYNLHVENFYSFIKINKELRDLDLKKNYEQKVALCEQAEALVLEPSVVEAFHKLQKLHDEWRETGPVANEYKEVLWERFKAASSRINKQHQEHFEALKGEQVRNLELKTELCAATEELAAQPLTTRKEWNRASDRLLEIQKTWKTIGFAPKKDNNRIYERFRTACDKFFEAKRQFYSGVKAEMEHNLQLKTEICEAAESLMNSEEWKKATDELIALQARWKEIGAVSRRHSDAIWRRFRAACDKFFERKGAHFASVDGEHEENLRKKLALLEEMAAADVKAGGYDVIREFQRRWGEIGFVPIKQKDAVQKKYKAAVDALFNTLRGTERDRSMNRFREKVSSFKSAGGNRLRSERERLYSKVRQLEQEIGLLENNIGFFAKSKNAESLIADVKAKIERAREEMAAAIEKVKLIDRQAQEENQEHNDNK